MNRKNCPYYKFHVRIQLHSPLFLSTLSRLNRSSWDFGNWELGIGVVLNASLCGNIEGHESLQVGKFFG